MSTDNRLSALFPPQSTAGDDAFGMNSATPAPLLEELARMAELLRETASGALATASQTSLPEMTSEDSPSPSIIPSQGHESGHTLNHAPAQSSNSEPEASRVGTTMTAVVKLVPHMDMLHWQEMASCGLCDGWFALDLPDHLRLELRRILENGPTQNQLPDAPGLSEAGAATSSRHDSNTHGLDSLTGMLAAPLFLERLTQEAERARRKHAPLSLALFEILPSDSATQGTSQVPAETPVLALADRIWQAARRQDLAGRLLPGILGLALPDVGHFQALALAERVISDVCRRMGLPHDGEAHAFRWPGGAPVCRLRAGVAELPGEGGAEQETAAVLEQAREALQQASAGLEASVRERVRLYRANTAPAERETLVLASEKQFLFFGGI